MKFIVDNLLDKAASITADDATTFNPIENIIIKRLADYWQTVTAGTKTISIILDTAVSIREIAIVHHNLVDGDEVTVQSFTDGAFTGTPVEKVLTVRDGVIYGYDETDIFHTTRYYKVIFEKNSGSELYVGFLFMGLTDFNVDHLSGSVPNYENNSQDSESAGFQSYYSIGTSRRVQEFGFGARKASAMRAVGIAQDSPLVPGVVIQTYKNLDKYEPYFGKLVSAKFSSRDYLLHPFSLSFAEVK